MRLLRADWQDMGVVHDRAGRTLTAALSLRGGSFALLGADEQDRRVGAWASVLSSLAREGSPVHRVQWVAASFPDDGQGVRSYLAAEAVSDAASACTASYDALLADMDSHTCAHDVVLAVQVRLTRSVEVGCATLAREVGSLVRLLADADVQVESVLSADDLAHQLLRTYEPHAVAAGAAPAQDHWPMAMEESWSEVRVDGMVHATFWVAEWPRIEVRSDFLAPLLLGSARSTLAVVMEPLGPDTAVRKVEASRTADLADTELRRRGGFISTARHARESEVLARREAELAEGHASFRYSGYVTVSAPSEEELVAACDVVQHAAGQSRLALRRLYGDQASAYTCTLPLCRGLACDGDRAATYHAAPCRAIASDARRRRRTGRGRAGRWAAQCRRAAARQPQPAHARQLRRHGVRHAAPRPVRPRAGGPLHVARHRFAAVHAGAPRHLVRLARLPLAALGLHRDLGGAHHRSSSGGPA